MLQTPARADQPVRVRGLPDRVRARPASRPTPGARSTSRSSAAASREAKLVSLRVRLRAGDQAPARAVGDQPGELALRARPALRPALVRPVQRLRRPAVGRADRARARPRAARHRRHPAPLRGRDADQRAAREGLPGPDQVRQPARARASTPCARSTRARPARRSPPTAPAPPASPAARWPASRCWSATRRRRRPADHRRLARARGPRARPRTRRSSTQLKAAGRDHPRQGQRDRAQRDGLATARRRATARCTARC